MRRIKAFGYKRDSDGDMITDWSELVIEGWFHLFTEEEGTLWATIETDEGKTEQHKAARCQFATPFNTGE